MSLDQPAASPLVWFLLVDAASGTPYKGTTADAVSLPPGSVVVQFRDAVHLKNSSILTGITSSQLLVYKNKTAFDKRNADDGKEEPLEEDTWVTGLGNSKKDALIVAVPSSIQSGTSLAKSRSLVVSDGNLETTANWSGMNVINSLPQKRAFEEGEMEVGVYPMALDGIAINQPHLSRESLVARVIEAAKESKFILLSSPAGTGKTSLLQLIKAKTPMKCIRIGLANQMRSLLTSLLDLGIDLEYDSVENDEPRIIMLDDAQKTYGEKLSWDTLLKNLATKIPETRFIIAATYLLEGGTDTPVEFLSFPKFGLNDMRLSDEEVHKLLHDDHIGLPSDCRDETLVSLIASQCGGIIAAVRLIVREMRIKFRHNQPRHTKDPPMAVRATRFFYSHNITTVMSRCFGSGHDDIPRYLVPLLIRCLNEPLSLEEVDDTYKHYVTTLIKSGILIQNGSYIDYSCEMARRYFYRWLFPTRGNDNPASLHDLIEKAIAKLSASQLKQSTSSDENFPKEATFQHHIHAALASCTKSDVSICPELSKGLPGVGEKIAGEIDFYLDGELQWGIELLIKGNGVKEHISRFGPQGKYTPLGVEDYAVIDFRVNSTGEVTNIIRRPHLISVFFKRGDFTSCKCAFSDGRNVEIQLQH